ncbi:hypothetical protein [Nocardioides sp.]|uniref:hypothetical protein n=1 Tax=Nocardioides sp. TaxID=35761 RepID=UPI002C75A9AC|nr:hypothetical protein [Nocardioides sp.]HXH78853.1 hypothetical protein [Nocardioides sp.]
MTNGYALGQLSKTFLTATTHEDPDVRRRADRRAQRWAQSMERMADGRVEVGARVPVRGLPKWVTLEVLRGGFATGSALAEVPLQADEIALARRLGIPAARRLIFGYFLTDAGLQELHDLLDSGAYRVEIPEDAALLTIAWLVRAGDRAGALDLLEQVSPFAEKLRLAPKPTNAPTTPPDHVFRITAGEAADALRSRKPNPRVEAQREALAVWNPFSDRVLSLWLEQYQDGQLSLDCDAAWRASASALVDECDRLATVHTLCTKYRKPKENLAILLRALKAVAGGENLLNRDIGLVRCAIEAQVAKRGRPESDEHAALRDQQRVVATAPAHSRLAAVAADRVSRLDVAEGIGEPEAFFGDVTAEEESQSGVAEGSAMPRIVPRVLTRAHSAPIEDLLEEGVVPSAEVLAALVPRVSASVVASAYADQALARLAAANYRAFRRRRSLLLLNLEKQIQITELPWVRAVAGHSHATTDEAMAVARRVGALALDHFPSTILPNPLVQELHHLLSTAGHDIPLVEELAADIFMGGFSDKFRRASQGATRVIGGTLYAKYYGIDSDQITSLAEPPKQQPTSGWTWRRARATEHGLTFGDLCWARAGRTPDGGWSVAANGMIIEQSQILTTHNLAALVSIGVQPTRSWMDLARDAIHRTSALLELASRQRRPLATVKDAAYAWRQAIFYLSVAGPAEAEKVLNDESVGAAGPAVMAELLDGLRQVAAGHVHADDRSPFLGWAVGRHWILEATDHPPALPGQ